MLIFWSLDLERMLIWQKNFLWKSAIYHSIKLPFDAQAAEKILNVIYYLCTEYRYWFNNIYPNLVRIALMETDIIFKDFTKVDIKHLVITNFMVLITNFAQEISYELLRNTTSMIFYNSLLIKVFWPMHFFRLNILESLFCCNICFIQSDYSIFFIKSLVENKFTELKFCIFVKTNFEPSNGHLK